MQLDVVVESNCPSCDEARRLARAVGKRFPDLSVRVFELDGRAPPPEPVVATPMYLLDGRALTFAWRDGAFADAETGSRWTLLGACAEGPLAGRRLEPVAHANPFWFVWAAFKPETRIVR